MIDDADQAAANEERAMEIFQRSRQERVSAPHAAGNTSINCVDCGEIVPPARLQAVPRTLRCARCAADVEARWNS
jgi:RNA polymerase-binding transcription factor DksA